MTKPSSTNKALVAAAVVLTLLTLLLSQLAYGRIQDSLRVSYINVGQGDSILLHASDDTDILIDGGPPVAGPTVVAYLQSEGVDDIEVMVLTHDDAQHIGGLIDVLRSTILVESVIYPHVCNGPICNSSTFQEVISETKKRGLTPTPATAPVTYTWGSLNAHVLNPPVVPTEHPDENSLVMLVVYGDIRFLFTADITSRIEQHILDTGALRIWVDADMLKVAQHGSEYASSAPFLEAVGAELAIISVGHGSLPAQETLDRLQAAGARVLRTDRNGTIVVTTDGQTYEAHVSSDLVITKRATPDPVQPGKQLTYTISVANTGNGGLHATITDTLPISASLDQTSGGTLVMPGGTVGITWTAVITAPSDVWMETVVVTVQEGYEGPLINLVEVTTKEGAAGKAIVIVNAYKTYLPLVLRNL